jgi:hypothetical protein
MNRWATEGRSNSPATTKPSSAHRYNTDFLRILWTNRLPPKIQPVIAAKSEASLDDVERLSEKVTEVSPNPHPGSVSESSDVSVLTVCRQTLRQVAAFSAHYPCHQTPTRTRRRTHISSHTAGHPTSDLCWYHHRFKQRAERCAAHCTLSQGNTNYSH